MQYVDLTPTWQQVLSMHWHLLQQVSRPIQNNRGGRDRFEVISRNFISEMTRMAAAADQWNEYCQARELASGAAEQDDAKRLNTLADSMEEEADAIATSLPILSPLLGDDL